MQYVSGLGRGEASKIAAPCTDNIGLRSCHTRFSFPPSPPAAATAPTWRDPLTWSRAPSRHATRRSTRWGCVDVRGEKGGRSGRRRRNREPVSISEWTETHRADDARDGPCSCTFVQNRYRASRPTSGSARAPTSAQRRNGQLGWVRTSASVRASGALWQGQQRPQRVKERRPAQSAAPQMPRGSLIMPSSHHDQIRPTQRV